jgi:glycosyltransferase involved in cell wall biosynthesis
MKILELTREYFPSIGGVERCIKDRTEVYSQLGIDFSIVATDFSTEKSLDHHHSDLIIRIPQYTRYNITPTLNRFLTDEIDIVSVNLLGRYYSDRSILHYSGKRQKIILTPYFAFHTEQFAWIKTPFERVIFPYLLAKVDALVVFSEVEKSFWQSRYRIETQKIHVIPPYQTVRITSESTHGTGGARYLLYLGRAGKNKKTDELLSSFLSTTTNDLALKLTIRPEDVSEKIRKFVFNDKRIELLGLVSEGRKNDLLKNCTALIFPTSWESFGYVAFEASEFRKPLLCSQLEIFQELLDPAGVIFFKNTQEDISRAIEEFARLSEGEVASMGTINFNNLKRYTFQSAVEKYRHLFSTF